MQITVEDHPLLAIRAWVAMFPGPLGALPSEPHLERQLNTVPEATAGRESLRQAVRDLLRHGGYKPTGRGKPASEYLIKAAAEGRLGSINAAVDVCNVVSLQSGFPISVVDVTRAQAPLHIAVAPSASRYVFNASGQEIDLSGLLCLFDSVGPCANAVKDSQRTKTWEGTSEAFYVVWGHRDYAAELDQAEKHAVELLCACGAQVIAAHA